MAILNISKRKGMTVWLIDNEYKGLTLEAEFQLEIDTIQFTSNNKHSMCGINDRAFFWSIVYKKLTSTQY